QAASGGSPPSGTLTVQPTANIGDFVTINFPTSDADGPTVVWDLWSSGYGGSNGNCCFSGSTVSKQFTQAGVFRVGVQAIDPQLNLSQRYSSVIRVGGATGTPPLASATLNGSAVNA